MVALLVGMAVLYSLFGCGLGAKTANRADADLGNSHEDQCKKILRAINRRHASFNGSFNLLMSSEAFSQNSSVNINSDKSPKVQRFNSRKETGKSSQELLQEESEKLVNDQLKEAGRQMRLVNDTLLKYLDGMISDIKNVKLLDPKLKELQTQLAQAYKQMRNESASNLMLNGKPIEEALQEDMKKIQEDARKMLGTNLNSKNPNLRDLQKQAQEAQKQIQESQKQSQENQQKMEDMQKKSQEKTKQSMKATTQIQLATSALNKYCGLE